ncbi:zinc-binding alcohol dehydrogenase family protein [Cyclobacterium qasimii]|uniref:Zinc-type alcohol dehydrogenase-like protein n=2 Tax=Cyclobacterium qasimii TaxID=1350429 RepID=S7WXN0_9BACT|nr:zinc-binding alcohol dehydrogenase family protein [Cyclobacterium qasimii]EPR68693.1 Bifunctional protein: zinc-containing alcohol dehydrogenase, quinone oxidoreductase (NADPH:quinone reductase) [Cyclobacterium qasimii M12-11B]GEO22732.1 NADPH:quinone reductase [Cyclobacterium qasimii]
MKAIGFRESLPISEKDSFIEFEADQPSPAGFDLLVKVAAVSVNPVDFKVRQSAAKENVLEEPKIIGYDAVGEIIAVGDKVSLFKEGDEVYYAGDLTRSGSNAAFQLIDERIVGAKPKSLSMAEAAALPLTGLTAWESIFDRMKVDPKTAKGKTILILAGAGGVGSIAIQIAKQVAGLTVIATASREETENWCKSMGADFVVNHNDLKSDLEKIGHKEVDYILDCVDINGYWETVIDIIKPQGHIVTISGNSEPLNLMLLKNKSVSFSWEFMFTRSMYTTDDIIRQHEILSEMANLVDKGILKSTLKTELRGFSVENFKKAHELQESGKTIGKTVIKF